jgi:hypothetical protein
MIMKKKIKKINYTKTRHAVGNMNVSRITGAVLSERQSLDESGCLGRAVLVFQVRCPGVISVEEGPFHEGSKCILWTGKAG